MDTFVVESQTTMPHHGSACKVHNAQYVQNGIIKRDETCQVVPLCFALTPAEQQRLVL
uniref:Uncharacterized protein n=1 Tax=Anguilla anguilla TaxID=7936 RepID=A0A0E9WES8_ANGAN